MNSNITTELSNEAQNPLLRVGAVMPSCLRLSLKTKWFEMTKSGIKKEDYREINEYWIRRLTNCKTDLTEAKKELLKGGKAAIARGAGALAPARAADHAASLWSGRRAGDDAKGGCRRAGDIAKLHLPAGKAHPFAPERGADPDEQLRGQERGG